MDIKEIQQQLDELFGVRISFYDDNEATEGTLLLGSIATNTEITDSHELIFEFRDDEAASLLVSCRGFCSQTDCSSKDIADVEGSWETVLAQAREISARFFICA